MLKTNDIINELKNNYEKHNLHHGMLFTFNNTNTKVEFLKTIKNNLNYIFNVENIKIDTELNHDISKKTIIDLIDKCYYKWNKNYPRIIFIDNLDILNIISYNSFLKLLEEPPINTYFFLFTNVPSKIIETVKSRCMIFNIESKPNKDYFHLNELNKYNIFLFKKQLLKFDKYEIEQDINLWYKNNYLDIDKENSKKFLEYFKRFMLQKNYSKSLDDILIIIWKVNYEKNT